VVAILVAVRVREQVGRRAGPGTGRQAAERVGSAAKAGGQDLLRQLPPAGDDVTGRDAAVSLRDRALAGQEARSQVRASPSVPILRSDDADDLR
jgi:hypothetical protein